MTLSTLRVDEFAKMKYGKMPKREILSDSGYPVYSGYRITGYAKEYLYSEPKLIVVARGVGGTGDVKISPPNSWITNLSIVLELDESKVDKRYLLYKLSREPLKEKLNTGAAQAQITIENLSSYKIRIPEISTQKSIVEVISQYDDLIENNKRRIELLEESARQLYKEWFVRFRFPGHEHVKIIDGVPEGWEKTTADQVINIFSGGTPKTKISDYWNGDIGFYTPKDSKGTVYVSNTEKTITSLGLEKCASKLYPKDTLFITARGTVGKLNLAQKPMAMNQSCYALVGKAPVNQIYLFFAMKAGIQQVKSRAVGAVFDAIIKDTFKVIPFVVPPERLIEEFTDYAKPILRQIDCLLTSMEKLTQARDILLPKLMNGEISL